MKPAEREILQFIMEKRDNFIIPAKSTKELLSNAVARCRAHIMNDYTMQTLLKRFIDTGDDVSVLNATFMYIRRKTNPRFLSLPMSIALYIIMTNDFSSEYRLSLEEHITKFYTNMLTECGGLEGYTAEMVKDILKM